MKEKLQNASELLKMLELVFGNAQADGRFPWAGVKLTLRQAQELIEEHLAEPAPKPAPKPALSQGGERQGVETRDVRIPESTAVSGHRTEHRVQESRQEARQTHKSEQRNNREEARIRAEATAAPVASHPVGRDPVSRDSAVRVPKGPPAFSGSRTTSSNSVEAPVRGTFNRVQLTEEPREESFAQGQTV